MRCNAYIDPETKIALNGEALMVASQNLDSLRCGRELSPDDIFCPSCGAKVNHTSYICSEPFDVGNQGTRQSRLDNGNDDENVALAIWSFGLCATGIVGAMILSVFSASKLWLVVLLLVLLGLINGAAESLLRVCMIAFYGRDENISSDRMRVLRGLSIAVVCVPLICPAYGFLQGGIESMRHVEEGKISMATYFINKSRMNIFTRVGYRWVYHIFWDFDGVDDDILDTSPFGLGGSLPQCFSDASKSDGEKDDYQTQLSQSLDDSKLGIKISTALMKNDHEEARRLARQISDKDLREWQLALVDNAESLDKSQKELKQNLKEIEDGMKAAAAFELLFGGR